MKMEFIVCITPSRMLSVERNFWENPGGGVSPFRREQGGKGGKGCSCRDHLSCAELYRKRFRRRLPEILPVLPPDWLY